MPTTLDRKVEHASDRLHELAEHAAGRGGLVARLADPLEEDAQFLRKLKPTLVTERVRRDAPSRPPTSLLLAAGALAAVFLLAKAIRRSG